MLLLLLVLTACTVHGFSRKRVYPKPAQISRNKKLRDVGEPLFVTPLLNSGKVEEARKLSLVTNLTSIVSYTGYFTVNETYNSNMFFWFFPAAVSSSH